MASTGKGNGTLFLLYLNDIAIAHCTNLSITHSIATRDTTTKSSGGWEEVEYALRSAEISGDFYFAEDGNYGFEDIWDMINARTKPSFKYSSEVSGDTKYKGTVLITNCQKTDPVEDTSTYSLTLKVTGAVSKASVT